MNNSLNELNNIDTGWDYSNLSELSCNHGGPEQLVEDIFTDGYCDGFSDGYPNGYNDGHEDGVSGVLQVVVPIALAAIAAITAWGVSIWQKHKKTKEEISNLAEEVSKLKATVYVSELKTSVNMIEPPNEDDEEDEKDNEDDGRGS